MPWDSLATSESAGAFRNASDKLASLQGNWDVQQRQMGIGVGYENNPYSQASLLVRQKEIGARGINQRPGQLYSGATINHLGQVEHGYSEGRARLQESYDAARAHEEREELATQHELQSEQEQAQAEAIQRAAEMAPEPAPAYEPASGGGGGGSKRGKQGGGFQKNKGIGGKGRGK